MTGDEEHHKKHADLRDLTAPTGETRSFSLSTRLRNYFLTGIVVAAPISITIYISWWFINLVDGWIKPLVPTIYNPETYLPFTVPGVGLVFAVIGLTLLGALAANLFGRTIVAYGEMMLNRMPIVRNVYSALKQIFETVLQQSNTTFQDVGVVEYPRKGLYALVFVSTSTKGEVQSRVEPGEELLSVFLPTTPNPTSGFLLFVPKKDVMILDMSVEEAAKMVISAGLVTPEYNDKTKALYQAAKEKRAAKNGKSLPAPATKETA